MPIDDEALKAYLGSLTVDQSEAIQKVRAMINELAPDLVESIDEGKWFTGLVTYSTPGGFFMFAIGPRAGGLTTFHMMPYYGSKELQELYSAALKPFLTGKSCIRFAKIEEVPMDALEGIVMKGTSKIFDMLEARARPRVKVSTRA